VIYLTFDDGPHETNTPTVLETLARHGAHATFFAEGRKVARHPETVRRIVHEGHVVGNHAWSHLRLSEVDAERIEAELFATSRVIEQACGSRPTVFRAPYGRLGDGAKPGEITAQARALGMEVVHWDVDSYDYTFPGRETVVANVVTDVKDGDIVLMHDNRPGIDAALEEVIIILGERGFGFAVLPITLTNPPEIA
jgi:peptidoglycan/xylan/chitin deacetylase (PgdA/CDA1 family)